MARKFRVVRTYFIEFPDDFTFQDVHDEFEQEYADDVDDFNFDSWDACAEAVSLVVDVGNMQPYVKEITSEVKSG